MPALKHRIFPVPGASPIQVFPGGPAGARKDKRPLEWVTPARGNEPYSTRDWDGWTIKDIGDELRLAAGFYNWQDQRRQDIDELLRRGTAESIALVVSMLADGYVHIQEVAILGLGALQEDSILKDLASGPLLKAQSELVRSGLAEALGRTGNQVVLPYVTQSLTDKAVNVRIQAARALGNLGSEAVPGLLTALRDGSDDVRAAAIESLKDLNATSAVEAIRDRGANDKSGLVRAVALESLGTLDPSGSVPTIVAGLGHPDYRVKIGAIRGLWAARAGGEIDAIAQMLSDKDWRVRRSAIYAIWLFRDVLMQGIGRIIPKLIDAMRVKSERGALKVDIRNALSDMLGTDQGSIPDTWADYWMRNKARADVIVPPGTMISKAQPESGPGTRGRKLFSLPVLTDRVAFILDLSGSMRDDLMGRQRKDVGPGTPASKAIGTKLWIAASAISDVINEMTGRFSVHIWRFPSVDQKAPQPKEEPGLKTQDAAPSAKANARGRLMNMAAYGWGDFYDPFMSVLSDAGEADTIILVSDGVPSRSIGGTSSQYEGSKERLFSEIERRNRYEKKTIHTIMMGKKGTDERFMVDLAELGGGISVKR